MGWFSQQGRIHGFGKKNSGKFSGKWGLGGGGLSRLLLTTKTWHIFGRICNVYLLYEVLGHPKIEGVEGVFGVPPPGSASVRLDIDYGDTKQHGGDKAWYSNEAVPNPRIQPPPKPNTHHLYIPDVPLEPPLITLTTATAAVAEGSRAIAYLTVSIQITSGAHLLAGEERALILGPRN